MFVLANTNAVGVNPWAQFGLAGIVIGALFGLVILMYRSHRDERTDWQKEHQAEREEWRQDAKANAKEVKEVVSGLTSLIQERGK